jgi:hypothetical protein
MIPVRILEVGDEVHDVELLLQTLHFGEGKEELVLVGQVAHVLALLQVGAEGFGLCVVGYEVEQDVNLLEWQRIQVKA